MNSLFISPLNHIWAKNFLPYIRYTTLLLLKFIPPLWLLMPCLRQTGGQQIN